MRKGPQLYDNLQLIFVLLMLIVAIASQACLCADDVVRDAASQTEPPPPQQQVLKVAIFEECDALNPYTASSDLDRELLPLVFEQLLELDEDGRRFVKGPLLESYRPIPGFHKGKGGVPCLKYQFQLRRDITFSDGTPVTGQDIATTIKRLRRSNGTFGSLGLSRFILAVKVKSAYRFNIQIRPHPRPESLFTFFVTSAEPIGRNPQGREHFVGRPIGTGPYRFDRLLPDGALRFVPNPHFHGARNGGIPIRAVVLRRYRQSESKNAVEDLSNGRLHMLVGLGSQQISHLKRVMDSCRIHRFHCRGVWVLAINHRHKLFQQRSARRALLLAIDRGTVFGRQTIEDSYSRNAESIVTGPFPPDSNAYDHTLPIRGQNTVVAKTLLQTLSPQVKEPFSLIFPDEDPRIANAIGQIKTQWKDVGLRVNARSMSHEEMREQLTGYHAFDVACYRIEHSDLLFDLSGLFDPSVRAMGPGGANFMGYAPQPLVQLFVDLRREQDGNQIWKIQNRIHRYLYDEVTLIPLWYLDNYVVWSPQVSCPSVAITPRNASFDRVPLFRRIEDWRIVSQK